MVEIPITIACGNYDRTRPIMDGRVKVEGCAVTCLPLYPVAFSRSLIGGGVLVAIRVLNPAWYLVLPWLKEQRDKLRSKMSIPCSPTLTYRGRQNQNTVLSAAYQ
jgi:hypothetical protein